MKSRILSGIQPSGVLHLGNYIGAVQQFVALQDTADNYYCIVDYHAITTAQEPEALRHNIRSLMAMYIAAGLDPEKVTLFKQSDVSAHTELAWILTTLTNMGQLSRMTQFKDKSAKANTGKAGNQDAIPVGLFTYPVLMAADILLYQPDIVPVGEDQKQHVELTRDLAGRFNHRFGEVFKVPQVQHSKSGARIMALDDATSKMSKSAASELSYIALTDTPELITKKIKKAQTDSGSEIKATDDKPAVKNLLTIYSAVTGKTIAELEQQYEGAGYGQFKGELAEAVVEFVTPIQTRYAELMADTAALDALFVAGKAKAEAVANETLQNVKQAIGVL